MKNETVDVTDILLDKAVDKLLVRLIPVLRSFVFPAEIEGNSRACDLLGVNDAVLRKRLQRGMYVEGIHYTKKSARIYVWNRDALLEVETNTFKGH